MESNTNQPDQVNAHYFEPLPPEELLPLLRKESRSSYSSPLKRDCQRVIGVYENDIVIFTKKLYTQIPNEAGEKGGASTLLGVKSKGYKIHFKPEAVINGTPPPQIRE
ncbi:MAG: hypothetical protein WCH99_07450 [Verrucomicrobiota bacterium]